MKTKLRRYSRRTVSMVLALLMMVSVLGIGSLITTSAADVHKNATGATSTTLYYAITSTDVGSYSVKCNTNHKGDGDDWHSYTMTDTGRTQTISGTTYKVYTTTFTDSYDGLGCIQFQLYNGSTWVSQVQPFGEKDWHSASDYNGKLWRKGGSSWLTYSPDPVLTKLSAPSLKYNSSTTTPVNVTANSVNLTWAAVSNASSYTVYKDGSSYQTSATSPFTVTETGSYTVKAIGNGTTYSDSDASNAIQVNLTKTTRIYVKKDLKNKNNQAVVGNAHIWSNSSDNWTGNWPGEAISTNWTEAGDYYYKDYSNTYNKFKVIFNKDSNQTSDSEEYVTGKTWVFKSVNTEGDNGQAVGTESYIVTIGTVTNGTVTSSVPAAASGATVTLTATPSSGYVNTKPTVTKEGGGTVTVSGSGTSYTFTMPAENVTVTDTFAADTTPTITSFTIDSGASATKNIGETATLASTKTNSSNNVSYSVTAETPTSGSGHVVSISGTTVTALQPGTATITASLTGATSKTVTVTVRTPSVTVTNYTSKKIGDTGSTGLAMTNGGSCTISYASDNNVVAVNASTGAWTAQKPGTATITGTISGGSYSTTKTFTVAVGEPTLSFATASKALKVGEEYTQTATSGNCTTAGTISYSTTSTYISVNASTGKVTAIKPTSSNQTVTATFSVTQGGQTTTQTATYNVTVTEPTVSVTSGASMNVDGTLSLTASSSNATTTPTYTWDKTNGTGTATISGSTLTALTPGTVTVTVTATYNANYSKTATKEITIATPIITQADVTIAKGDSKTLSTATTNPSSGLTVTFALSGSPNGVTCTSAGVVTVAQNSSASTATVVATAKNSGDTTVATKNITVTIANPSLNVKDGSTGVADNGTTHNTVYTTMGTNKTLTVETNFSDGLFVKSNDTSVATVALSNGTLTITPVAKGTTTIIVSTNNNATIAQSLAARVLTNKKYRYAVGAVDEQTAYFTVNVAEAETSKLILFTDNYNWGSAYIYYNGKGLYQMTKIGTNENGQDVYGYNLPIAEWNNFAYFVFAKDTNWSTQTVNITDKNTGYYISGDGNDVKSRTAGNYTHSVNVPQIVIDDATINMGENYTLNATKVNSADVGNYKWSSATTSVATVTADTGTTASTAVTTVNVGSSVVTAKAFATNPTNWNLTYNDTTLPLIGSSDTATITVTADPKTVTFGAKKTDNGSTFTDLSGVVSAKYYDAAAASESGSSESSSGSGGSGAGAGYYLWYNTNNSKDLDAATSAGEMIDLGNGTCYTSFTCAAGQNYDVVINNSNTKGSCLTSSTTVSGNQTWAKVENNGTTYWALDSYSAAVPIYVIYNPTSNSVRFTTSNPAGSSSGGSSGSSGSGSGTETTGEGTTMTSPHSVPYGKVAVFTALDTTTVSGTAYKFAEWVDGSNNTLSTDTEYTVKVTEAKTVYARYYKVYKLSAFDSYESDGSTVTYKTAPPKMITIQHGTDVYLYTYDGTASTGNPDSPDGDNTAALPIESGTYGQGNYIQYYAGDTITLYYNAMASSEIFKGVFYNNSANYYIAKPTASQFVSHTYDNTHVLYMNSSYYDSVPSGLPTTTVNHDNHSIQFYGTQDYKNIDVEMATKRKVYFSDYTNAIIGSKNTDDYYYDGEALSATGDQLTVKAAGSATQTNSIDKDNIKFYRADANGQPTGSALSGFTVAYDSGTDPVTNSGATASTRYIIISGSMPAYDLYVDLGMTSSYTIKLGSKVISDTFANNTRLAQVANVTIKEGSTTKLTAPDNADVTSASAVDSGTVLTLTTAYTGSWDDYYTFVGWYWGDDSAPDYEKGFISDKLSLNYTPKKGGTIWAVGTRSLYINGSKYITGKDTDWYGENNVQKNLEMSFDAESGRYYWEITDTMFAAAGSNYKTWGVTDWNEKHTDYGVYAYSDAYYWTDNDDKYHGKSFFQILDQESGSADKTIWDSITSFKVDTPANGPTYGKIYPRDYNDDYYKKHDGQGFINFNETEYAGQSSPLRIYFNPSASGNDRLTVESTKIYSNLYVSNGFTVGSTLRTSNVTVEPVVDGVVKTSGQTGYFSVGKQGDGWDPDVEGHVNHYKPQKKGATVRITKTAGGSDKIAAFFIYDITNKTVRAEKDVKKSGSNYYIDLTLANSEQNLYIVPIVEEAGANVTITFDATQLNRKQWGDIVTAYAWYSGTGGNALGGYPGQPMIPSDDMTTWTTKFKGTNSNNDELQGITFSNYVDGNHSWLGCSGVMGTVSDHTTGAADGGIVNVYNHIYSGTSGEYSRTNFKAQTYDYREPIALYDRFKNNADDISISFSMKDGNSSLLSWRHSELLSHNIVTLEPHSDWSKLNWEYLTNAKGDKYIDLNGNTMKTKPTASFYIAAKGQVLYNNSSMTNVFYSGKSYDGVSGVTYGAASGIGMNYAVQWYVYDASGNYITNVLTAGIADLSTNEVDSYIGKVLEDMGYAVDGKSVSICYDKPRYMYGDAESGTGATGYNNKVINVGDNFDAYRFTGQWNAVASSELVTVKVGVGMMTDSGEVLANSNTAAYGNASAFYDTTKGNNVSVTNEDGDTAPFTASDGSFVRTAVRDASNNPVKLNASAQNFIGWYYYDANTGDFVKATYTSNENFYPSYSTKDVTFYAMYRASAIYQYNYTGREGARTYSASGEDLTAAEMGDNNVINPASHVKNIKDNVPSGIGVFKKDIDFSPTNYDSWTKTPDSNGYILNISGFATSVPEYTLTAYYKDGSGQLQTMDKTAAYNGAAVNLTDLNGGIPVTSYYSGGTFCGWYEYDHATQTKGALISTQTNYGLRLTRNQEVIAVYSNDSAYDSNDYVDDWFVNIDENEVNKELTTAETGVYYNDTIVRVRKGSNVQATLPDGAKIGVIVVCDNKTNETIDGYNTTQLTTLANSVTAGSTRKTAKGLSITNMQASSQTNFNRTDLAVRCDYKNTLGSKYCVYAYLKVGSTYHFSAVSDVKTYE